MEPSSAMLRQSLGFHPNSANVVMCGRVSPPHLIGLVGTVSPAWSKDFSQPPNPNYPRCGQFFCSDQSPGTQILESSLQIALVFKDKFFYKLFRFFPERPLHPLLQISFWTQVACSVFQPSTLKTSSH